MNSKVLVHQVRFQHLASHNSQAFRSGLLSVVRQVPRAIILDMSLVETIDSTCLGVIALTGKLLPRGSRLVLAAVQPPVRTLCEITRINRVMGIASSIEEALGLVEASPADVVFTLGGRSEVREEVTTRDFT